MQDELSHVDRAGVARMVDVQAKPETARRALVEARVRFGPGVRARVLAGDLPKGAVLETARFAGVQGAKRTSDLIPMCHPLRLTKIAIDFEPCGVDEILIKAEVCAVDRTGVEMEALTAAATAALTIYDMVKAVDRGLVIREIRLLEKEGGKGGPWRAEGAVPGDGSKNA